MEGAGVSGESSGTVRVSATSQVSLAPGTDVLYTIWDGIPPPAVQNPPALVLNTKRQRVLAAIQETYKDA